MSVLPVKPWILQNCLLFPLVTGLDSKLLLTTLTRILDLPFKRHNNRTVSMHACNAYASQDRIDFSSLSDVNPAAPQIDVQKLLIGKAEVDSLNGDVVVLLSR